MLLELKKNHNQTNVSQTITKAAQILQKSPKGAPETEADSGKRSKNIAKGIPESVLKRALKMRPLFSPNVSKT